MPRYLKSKMDDAYKLVKAKCYVLVTEDEATISGNFTGMEKTMAYAALLGLRDRVTSMADKFRKEMNGGDSTGRNKRRKDK